MVVVVVGSGGERGGPSPPATVVVVVVGVSVVVVVIGIAVVVVVILAGVNGLTVVDVRRVGGINVGFIEPLLSAVVVPSSFSIGISERW